MNSATWGHHRVDHVVGRKPLEDLAVPGVLLGRNAAVVSHIVSHPVDVGHSRVLNRVQLDALGGGEALAIVLAPLGRDHHDPLLPERARDGANGDEGADGGGRHGGVVVDAFRFRSAAELATSGWIEWLQRRRLQCRTSAGRGRRLRLWHLRLRSTSS